MNPSTVDVACPRCDVPITCTLRLSSAPTPGDKVSVNVNASVPDLAERFAAHYRDAGHVSLAPDGLFAPGAAAAARPDFQRAGDRAAEAIGRLRVEQEKLDTLTASDACHERVVAQSERVAKASERLSRVCREGGVDE